MFQFFDQAGVDSGGEFRSVGESAADQLVSSFANQSDHFGMPSVIGASANEDQSGLS